MHTCMHLNGVRARSGVADQGSLQVWCSAVDQDSITLAPHIHVVVKMLSRTLDPDLLSQSCGCDAVCWVIVLVAQLVLRRT